MQKPEIDLSNEHLDKLSKEFLSYQMQKARDRGGVEGRILVNLAMYLGEQWVWHEAGRLLNKPAEKNNPLLIVNKIKPRVRKLIGRFCAISPEINATPDNPDPDKIALADQVVKLDRAVEQKVGEKTLARHRWWWLILGGYCAEYVAWRPDVSVEPVPILGPDGRALWLDTRAGDIKVSDSNRDELLAQGILLTEEMMQMQVESGVQPETFEVAQELQLIGDVVSEIVSPLNLFGPPGIQSIDALSPDQSICVARIRTLAWIERNYPDAPVEKLKDLSEFKVVRTDISQVGATFSNHNLNDLIPVVQGSKSETDPDMAVVVERWQPPGSILPKGWSGNPDNAHGGRYTVFVPNVAVLSDGEIPYADGIPLVDVHFDPTTTAFASSALVDDAVPIQKAINKIESQIQRFLNTWVQSPVLTEDDFDADKWPTDTPGFFKGGLRDGTPTVARLQGAQLPTWIVNKLDGLYAQLDDVFGGADLFKEFKFPGQIRGSQAFPMLQEILDTEWGPVLLHYGECLAKIKQKRMNRLKQFYSPSRTLLYSSSRDKDDVMVFHASEILQAGAEFNITIEPTSLVPELGNMREARIRDRLESPLSILYMDERTGQIDKNKVAADMRFGDPARESPEANHRKFAKKVIELLIQGRPAPPFLPMQNHSAFLDEMSAVINDMGFFSLSQQAQQALMARSQEHQQFLDQQQQQQQQAAQSQEAQAAARQAAQQTAAKVASDVMAMYSEQIMQVVQQYGPEAAMQMLQSQSQGAEQPQEQQQPVQ